MDRIAARRESPGMPRGGRRTPGSSPGVLPGKPGGDPNSPSNATARTSRVPGRRDSRLARKRDVGGSPYARMTGKIAAIVSLDVLGSPRIRCGGLVGDRAARLQASGPFGGGAADRRPAIVRDDFASTTRRSPLNGEMPGTTDAASLRPCLGVPGGGYAEAAPRAAPVQRQHPAKRGEGQGLSSLESPGMPAAKSASARGVYLAAVGMRFSV